MIVNSHCPVSFSIGQKYFDEVWCDVVAMDACHLLLERPWQYDRKVSYDGRQNTYTFWKDRQKITLASMKIGDLPKRDLKTSINLLMHRSYLKEVSNLRMNSFQLGKDDADIIAIRN